MILFMTTGCELLELERNNPFDQKNENYNPLPEIIYYHYYLLNTNPWYSNKVLPGETIAIYVVLKNIGVFEAKNVTAEYTVSSPYANVTEKNSSIGNISPDDYSIAKENLILKIDNDAPVGEKINISMNLKDELDNTWYINFSIVIE